ncbi:MAG: sensor histidine kinase [Clostridia bacterium]|nr:sensor histidine kinase [Clostridia bacterium]
MKKLTGSIAAKTAAVILSFATAVISVVCVFSVAFMYSERFYTKSLEQIKEEKYEDILYKAANNIADAYSEQDTYRLKDYSTLYYTITDSESVETLFNTFENQKYIGKAFFDDMPIKAVYDENSTESENTEKAVNNIDITVYAAENYPLSYTSLFYLKASELLYPLRYGIIFIGFLSLLSFVLLLVFLFTAAGRRADGVVRLSSADKIPFDLLSVAVFLIAILSLRLLSENFGSMELVAVKGALIFSADYFIVLFYLMSFATRIKTETLIKNNIIYKVLKFVGKNLKKFFRFIGFIFKNLSLVKKTLLVCAAVIAFDLLVFVFCMSSYLFEVFIVFAGVNALAILCIIILTVIQLQRIKKGGERIAEGDLEYKIDTSYMYPEFKVFCTSLNNISCGMQNAVNEKMRSERMRTELITNVSHDIKTPLTSIINYVDLIKKEKPENEKVKEYLDVLDRQSVRLKKLIEDLVEASKASTGNLTVYLTECEAGVLLSQTVGEFDERLRDAGLTPILNMPETPVKIMADGRRLWRVFENLMSNVCKYSLSGTRAYMELYEKDGKAFIVFKNISKCELNISGDELVERFVRGDTSRNTEGSGLGLSIAKSLTELQKGEMRIEVDGDLFKVTLIFDAI